MAESKLVCVTGASGFVASHCIQQLLEAGYRVRGTVRDPSDDKKTAFLKKIAQDANASDRLELVQGQLLEDDSFDKAVAGCDYVLHTASPFFIDQKGDPDEVFIKPAVHGTENVLMSVAKAPTVKRVVLTSSCAAIYGRPTDKDGLFTEEDWNRSSTRKDGAYMLSKRLAEEKAWEIAQAQDKYELIVINPAFVMGPTLSGRGTASYDFLTKLVDGTMSSGAPKLMMGMVDVRDVAKAHITAMTHPNAKGRYIVAPESLTPVDMADAIRDTFPNLKLPRSYVPKFLLYLVGPFMGMSWSFISNSVGHELRFDNSKIKKEMDFEFRPIKQALIDMTQAGIDTGLFDYPEDK
eukprot:TRINITY_DN6743_c0_g1_i4.p1 TRINITY_DN6743_c0_g1~~TRINITY_DN6743_c0_g1_i4.p1  ORF type:complete len:395 (+),score=108.35 TRINITY_DN6743_c0_g1_i4:137-1186(+)